MYRKIEFRAKSLKDKRVFGDLNLKSCVHPHIHTGLFTKENIKQSTISQFTGLKDKNGIKIFEDDIVEWTYDEHKIHKEAVTYTDGGFYPLVNQKIKNGIVLNLKIIGNILTTPKLLENEDKE